MISYNCPACGAVYEAWPTSVRVVGFCDGCDSVLTQDLVPEALGEK